jgi:molybdopterin molybdotransferase
MLEPAMIDICSLEPKGLVSLDKALNLIIQAIQPVTTAEETGLSDALGRVLASDVLSPIAIPSGRTAAMDGFALASADIDDKNAFCLSLAGTSWAGKPFEGRLNLGHCVRIFTGAIVPDGADSVIMQENAVASGEKISFSAGARPLENVREAGEDTGQGGLLCIKGKILNPADIGLLAAAGIRVVKVNRQLNITFFSTGDELAAIGQPLMAGKIYDSNRYALAGLLSLPWVNRIDLGVIPDNKQELQARINQAAVASDVIISTGGASVGEADYIKEVLANLGEVSLWKIAVKPGKPLIFGKIGACYYFGLPGNPVSMMVTYQQIVAPALNKLSGANPFTRLRFSAVCTTPLKKSAGREEFQRGILTQDAEGNFHVASTGNQGAHVLSSMAKANCFIILPAENCGVKPGERVIVEPFANVI